MMVVDAVGVVRDVVFMSGFSGEGCRAGWSGHLERVGRGGGTDHCRDGGGLGVRGRIHGDGGKFMIPSMVSFTWLEGSHHLQQTGYFNISI